MITVAGREKFASLQALWQECFGDSKDYLRFFFKNRFDACIPLVYERQGVLLGAVYLFPTQICGLGGNLRPAWYIYAGGVQESFRRQGVFAALLQFIGEQVVQKQQPFLLSPANDQVAGYFLRLGLRPLYWLKRTVLRPETPGSPVSLEPLDAPTYLKLRNTRFKAPGYVQWAQEDLAYALAENAFCSGFATLVRIGNSAYGALGRMEKQELFLRETTAPEHAVCQVAGALGAAYGAQRVTALLPAHSPLSGKLQMVGLGLGMEPYPNGYFNLYWN